MENQKIIRKVALAVFKDKKLLCVRSRSQEEVFYSLGGKVESGESDMEALRREVQEEIGCTKHPPWRWIPPYTSVITLFCCSLLNYLSTQHQYQIVLGWVLRG